MYGLSKSNLYESPASGRLLRAHGTIRPWMLWFALIVIVIIFLPQISANLSSLGPILSGKPTGSGTNLVSVQKPIQFTCFDALSGSNCGAVTVKLYSGTSPNSAESLTATASGVATTGNVYKTGTALTIGISGNSKATEYIPFTVPGMDANSAISASNNVVAVYAVTLGAWTQVITGTGGTTFTSSTTLLHGLNAFSGNSVVLTDQISETTANAGYKSSYDITNLLNNYWLVQLDDGGGANSNTQYALISGPTSSFKLGNTNYYFFVCPDGLVSGFGFTTVSAGSYIQVGSQSNGITTSGCTGSLSLQSIGNQAFGGAVSFTVTVALGSLASGGNIETFQLKMYYYADPAYFAANNGNLGTSATQSGSTFTIKFTA